MKKIFFASLSGLILLVVLAGVVLVAGARQNVSASEPQPQFEDVLPPPIVVVLETDEDNPEKPDEILREIENLSLLENTDGHFIKPGWLFHSYKVEYLGRSDNFVQDDFSIPTEYTMELWFLIGDNERVGSAVTFMKDKAGNVIQTAVFHDGVWRNLTVKDSDYKQEPFEPGLGFGFANGAREYPQNLSWEETEEFFIYTLSLPLANSIQLAGNDQPHWGVIKKAYFYKNGRGLFKMETYDILPDGKGRLSEVLTVLALKNVDILPEYVEKVLKEVQQ
ncbi:MAG: hypothetical protein R6W69_07565 [Anaerolineales bacterium]